MAFFKGEEPGPAVFEPITAAEWAYIEEIARDLRTCIEITNRRENAGVFTDPFTGWLAVWSVLLGVLAWETVTSVIVLLRADKVRSAFALSRSLYENVMRMCYYRLQAGPIADSWRCDPADRKIEDELARMDACKDWWSISTRMAKHLQYLDPDLSEMSVDERRMFEQALAGEASPRNYRRIIKDVPGDKKAQGRSIIQWAHRSAFLHGDPLTRLDVMHERQEANEFHYDERFDDSKIPPRYILAQCAIHALSLLHEVHTITGFGYSYYYHARRLKTVFPFVKETDEGVVIRA
jgi:hypothetical protein